MEDLNARISNIESQLIGKWCNDTIGLFFDGTIGTGDLGEVEIGEPNLVIAGTCKYQVFIRGGNPFLRIINEPINKEMQVMEWEILEIYAPHKILRVRDKFGNEIIFHTP
jgi:hypothetical protein